MSEASIIANGTGPLWARRLARAASNLDLDDADRAYLAARFKAWDDRDLRPKLENQSTAQLEHFLRSLLVGGWAR